MPRIRLLRRVAAPALLLATLAVVGATPAVRAYHKSGLYEAVTGLENRLPDCAKGKGPTPATCDWRNAWGEHFKKHDDQHVIALIAHLTFELSFKILGSPSVVEPGSTQKLRLKATGELTGEGGQWDTPAINFLDDGTVEALTAGIEPCQGLQIAPEKQCEQLSGHPLHRPFGDPIEGAWEDAWEVTRENGDAANVTCSTSSTDAREADCTIATTEPPGKITIALTRALKNFKWHGTRDIIWPPPEDPYQDFKLVYSRKVTVGDVQAPKPVIDETCKDPEATPTVSWEAVTAAEKYRVRFYQKDAADPETTVDTDGPQTSIAVPSDPHDFLNPDQEGEFSVRAILAGGRRSLWSDRAPFTIGKAPQLATHLEPADASEHSRASTVTFKWEHPQADYDHDRVGTTKHVVRGPQPCSGSACEVRIVTIGPTGETNPKSIDFDLSQLRAGTGQPEYQWRIRTLHPLGCAKPLSTPWTIKLKDAHEPTAQISCPSTGIVGESLTCKGGGEDEDSDLATYEWWRGDPPDHAHTEPQEGPTAVPNASNFGIPPESATDAVTYSFVPPASGTYRFQFLVHDSEGFSAEAFRDVVVRARPAVSVTAPASVATGSTYTADGSATDEDGNMKSWEWRVARIPPGEPTPACVEPVVASGDVPDDQRSSFSKSQEVTATEDGKYCACFAVTDDTDLTGTAQACTEASAGGGGGETPRPRLPLPGYIERPP